jgi:hypothetical protein
VRPGGVAVLWVGRTRRLAVARVAEQLAAHRESGWAPRPPQDRPGAVAYPRPGFRSVPSPSAAAVGVRSHR